MEIGRFDLKKLYLIILSSLIIIGCSTQKANYSMLSEMNLLHPIEIIYFDDNTAKAIGDFPIDRKYHADILDIIEASSPKAVILKFFFDSNTESDQALHNAISKYDNVFTQTTSLISSDEPINLNQVKELSLQNFNIQNLSSSDSILLPNNTIFQDFAGIGFVDMKTKNNSYKNYSIVSKVGDYILPSLALSIASYVSNSDPAFKEDKLILGDKKIETNKGYLKIDLSIPGDFYKTHSFIDILNKSDEADFYNKIVIVYIDHQSVRRISSDYGMVHNNAEIIADSINTMLKGLE
jgi:hypothetical protein